MSTLTIAMVAGEASGDNLGAPLIRQIKAKHPSAKIIGIGGPNMIAEGMESRFDIERLSVNGFVEPLKRLPDLIRMLRELRDVVVASNADCFVGIDFNFFNLLLAGMLKKKGIRTAHYVSPTVWAWRQGRIRSIARRVDLMMTLYPFETKIYEDHGIPVVFVGHPKALEISPSEGSENKSPTRESLGIGEADRVLAILPGSRGSEVELTGRDFLRAASLLAGEFDRFIIPAANTSRHEQLQVMLPDYPRLDGKVLLLLGQSREAMTAADVVMVNSGTATLEAMLLRKPMVMSYRLGTITYAIVSRMMKTEYFALPNILAGEKLVPELIQSAATPGGLSRAVLSCRDDANRDSLAVRFDEIHQALRKNEEPGLEAAEAVLDLCGADS